MQQTSLFPFAVVGWHTVVSPEWLGHPRRCSRWRQTDWIYRTPPVASAAALRMRYVSRHKRSLVQWQSQRNLHLDVSPRDLGYQHTVSACCSLCVFSLFTVWWVPRLKEGATGRGSSLRRLFFLRSAGARQPTGARCPDSSSRTGRRSDSATAW